MSLEGTQFDPEQHLSLSGTPPLLPVFGCFATMAFIQVSVFGNGQIVLNTTWSLSDLLRKRDNSSVCPSPKIFLPIIPCPSWLLLPPFYYVRPSFKLNCLICSPSKILPSSTPGSTLPEPSHSGPSAPVVTGA